MVPTYQMKRYQKSLCPNQVTSMLSVSMASTSFPRDTKLVSDTKVLQGEHIDEDCQPSGKDILESVKLMPFTRTPWQTSRWKLKRRGTFLSTTFWEEINSSDMESLYIDTWAIFSFVSREVVWVLSVALINGRIWRPFGRRTDERKVHKLQQTFCEDVGFDDSGELELDFRICSSICTQLLT